MAEAAKAAGSTSRRSFLAKVLIGAAVVGGVTAAMQKKVFGKPVAVSPLRLPEDSIFAPRSDQARKILGQD